MKPDWNAIRAEYIAGEISIRKLAEKWSVPFGTLKGRLYKEGWDEAKKEAKKNAIKKQAQITADVAAENAAIAARIKQKLLKKLENEIESLPDSIGSEMRQNLQERIYDDSEQAKGRLAKIKDASKAYKISDLVTSYIRLTEGMITGEQPITPDDGFLDALNGSAAEDWSDPDD